MRIEGRICHTCLCEMDAACARHSSAMMTMTMTTLHELFYTSQHICRSVYFVVSTRSSFTVVSSVGYEHSNRLHAQHWERILAQRNHFMMNVLSRNCIVKWSATRSEQTWHLVSTISTRILHSQYALNAELLAFYQSNFIKRTSTLQHHFIELEHTLLYPFCVRVRM